MNRGLAVAAVSLCLAGSGTVRGIAGDTAAAGTDAPGWRMAAERTAAVPARRTVSPSGAVGRLLEGPAGRGTVPAAEERDAVPAARDVVDAGVVRPRAWVAAETPKGTSETRYDAPAGTGTATRLSLSSSSLFGDSPLAWRVLLEGRADRTDPELSFRGASWRLFRGERDAWWLGMETDDLGANRATLSLELAF